MNNAGPFASLTNIFVLMLENRSFDNIFAMSGIPGIQAGTVRDGNSCTPPGSSTPTTYRLQDGAPPCMTTDPGHEFKDVLEQLCGADAARKYEGGAYPTVNNSGFASNYATSRTEHTGTPTTDHIGDIMACFHTETQLPVIHRLATEFAICDNWFSSMPGPTWPNRFFVHGASSALWTDSPHLGDEVEWLAAPRLGFRYANGSIFHALSDAKHQWRLYQDTKNRFSDHPSGPEFGGWISQVAALEGITLLDVHSLDSFASDLQEKDKDNPDRPAYFKYPYTFIEPNFGKSFFAPQDRDKGTWYDGPTYKGGSSQHPEDDPSGGEGLIKAVYEAIRNSPLWSTSLLVIVYDEHGGFFDSAKPGPATPPGDKSPWLQKTRNALEFDFSQYGVRVPAVVVSPLIPKGTVDHTVYDHASILATLERLLGIKPLTARDAAANDLGHLLTLPVPRDDADCPRTLPSPAPGIPGQPVGPDGGSAKVLDDSLPESGNVIGFLHILLKAELELGARTKAEQEKILANFRTITTKGRARDYILSVRQMVEAAGNKPA